MIPSEIDNAIDQQAPVDREESVIEVPHIPVDVRKDKYDRAVQWYLDGKLTEDEFEDEVWRALRGYIEYHEAIESVFGEITTRTFTPEGSMFQYFGVVIPEGQPIILEEYPSYEEMLEIVE